MSIREEFEKEKNDWDNTCVGCTGGSDKCYKNWLEAKLQQEREANRELLEVIKERRNRILTKIRNAVNENFGYCPPDKWFDELLIERDKLQQLIKKHSKENEV
jgi:hypothetical protein